MCIVCQTAMSAAAVLVSLLPTIPDALVPADSSASIAGKRCTARGTTRTAAGIRYQCVAGGATLRWKKVGTKTKSAVTTSTTTPTTTTTSTTTPTTTTVEPYREPTVASAARSLCKLQDQSRMRTSNGDLLVGFPLIEKNFASRGTFTFALIPIDFADLPGEANVMSRVNSQIQLMTDWYEMVSDGRVKIEWRVQQNWVRVPGEAGSYALNRSRSDDNSLAVAAFRAADSGFDFSGVRAVAFVLPAAQTFMSEGVQGFLHSQFGYAGGYATSEGRVFNYMIAGSYFDRQYKSYWSYWAHETGHMFPLVDLYDQNTQWWIGKQTEIPGGPFSGFDMMASQDGPSRTLSGWLRFVMGWLSDEQVFCKPLSELGTATATLVPIDNRTSGLKVVLIPISESKVLVIESRRTNDKFDCEGTGVSTPTWRARNGVIVYTADMTLGHGEGFQALVAPPGRGLQQLGTCSAPSQFDAILGVGDAVSTNGVRVRVVSSGLYDTIEVSRL